MSSSRFVIFVSLLLFATHEAARMKRRLDSPPEKKTPSAFSQSAETGRLLMVRASTGRVMRGNSDGQDFETLLSGTTPCGHLKGTPMMDAVEGFTRASGLAVDEAAGLVFWSEWLAASPVIHFSDIQNSVDSTYPDITKDTEFPSEGYERWSLNHTIWRGTLSGSEVWPIITEAAVLRFFPPNEDGTLKYPLKPHPAWAYWPRQVKIDHPATVEVDSTAKRVYWAEIEPGAAHKISSSTYDGTDIKTHLYACNMDSGINTGRFRVDAANQKLYFIDQGDAAHHRGWHILRSNYDGTSVENVVRFEFRPMSFVLDLEENLIYVAADGTTKHPPGIYKTGLSGRRRSTATHGACQRENIQDDCEYILRIPITKVAKPSSDMETVPADEVYRPRDLVLDKAKNAIYWTGYIHHDLWNAKNYRTCIYNHPPKKPEDFSSDESDVYGDVTETYSNSVMGEISLIRGATDSSDSATPCSATPQTSSCTDAYESCPKIAQRELDSKSSAPGNCGQTVYATACCASCSSGGGTEDETEDDSLPTCSILTEEWDGQRIPTATSQALENMAQKKDQEAAALQAATCGGVAGPCSTAKDTVKQHGDCCMQEQDGNCAPGFELRSHSKYVEGVCQALESENAEDKKDDDGGGLQAATCGGVAGPCSTAKDAVKQHGDCCMQEQDGNCASGFELRSHSKYVEGVCQALERPGEEAASCIEAEFDIGYGDCSTYGVGKSNHGFCSEDADEEGTLAQDVCPQCNVCTAGEGSDDSGDTENEDAKDSHPTKAPKGPISAGDVSCTTSKFQAESGAPMEPGQCKGCLVQMNTGPPMCSYHFAGKVACQPEEGSVWCGE